MNPQFDLGIRCGHFLSMAQGKAEPKTDQFVGIRNGLIAEVSPWTEDKKSKCKDWLDGQNKLVMPGMVNGHTHLAMTLFRGLEDDAPFHKWLFERILPLEEKFVDSEFVRIGTELAALECIRFGVTSVNDMYFFTETIADVLDRAGLRGLIGQGFNNFPMPEDKVLGTNKTYLFERFFEKYSKHDRIFPCIAPHAPYTCGDDLFREVARLSNKHSARIHVHLSETTNEVQDSLKTYGKSPVQRLFELGVITSKTIAAHCVHLSEDDIRLMNQEGASAIYNPDSNLKLSSGIAPVVKMRKAGVSVGLGTDGAASNNDLSLFGVMDVGTKLQKLASGDNTAMVAADALACATWEGARALGLGDRTGSLEIGKDADLVILNLDHPHFQPVYDIKSLLVYAAQGLEVETVVCKGRKLMEKGRILTLDSERIYSEARALKNTIQNSIAT